MKTRLNEFAEQLEAIDRGCLPYADNDQAEVDTCTVAMKELEQIMKVASELHAQLLQRRGEFQELLRFVKEATR